MKIPHKIARIVRALGISLCCLSAASLAHAQWVKVANESDAVVTSAPVTVRYGSGTSWATQTMQGTIAANNTTFGDPIPGTLKELDVQQTSTVQTVVVNGNPVSVPALAISGTSSAAATTATTQPVTGTPQATSATCKIPRNGGSCTITFPNVSVPGQTLQLPSASGTYAFSCTGDLQHLSCTAVKQ